MTGGTRSGEQPGCRAVLEPVGAECFEQSWRERHAAILAPLGLADVEHHPGAVDVLDAQSHNLTDAQAAAVSGLGAEAVHRIGDGVDECGNLLGAENHGERLGPLAIGDRGDHIGPAERGAVEEPQGADGLVEGVPGNAPVVEQVELVGPNLFGAEMLGRSIEVGGEANDGGEVDADGLGREVAELEVFEEALTQWGHGPASGESVAARVAVRRQSDTQTREMRKAKMDTHRPRASNQHPTPVTLLPTTAQRFSSTTRRDIFPRSVTLGRPRWTRNRSHPRLIARAVNRDSPWKFKDLIVVAKWCLA